MHIPCREAAEAPFLPAPKGVSGALAIGSECRRAVDDISSHLSGSLSGRTRQFRDSIVFLGLRLDAVLSAAYGMCTISSSRSPRRCYRSRNGLLDLGGYIVGSFRRFIAHIERAVSVNSNGKTNWNRAPFLPSDNAES